ncbi:MAG: hypothetical protein EPO16_09595 [Dehalococcoidia bacterium]|nr:MAG: hypothetical protein EPO16_09595 [Dehalococcoidia bacterium]
MPHVPNAGWLRRRIDDIRRNHGLEHATVSVLLARRGPQRIAGRAAADGFYILGRVDDATLRSCAEEALARMQRGEANLAVSPLCGTNIAVTGAVTAAATMASLARRPRDGVRDRFGSAFTAATLGVVLAQPLGHLVQAHLTTRADLAGFELVSVRTLLPGVRKVVTRHAA